MAHDAPSPSEAVQARPSAHADVASVRVHVPFCDCDPLGVVWHGHYLRYFEHARRRLFQQLQLDVPDIRAMGLKMYVAESRCRHLFPLRYDDVAEIEARLHARGALLRVSYTVYNVTRERKCARAYTNLALTDAQDTLLTTLPEAIDARMPSP